MNKDRRSRLGEIQDMISDIIYEVENIKTEEEEALNNMPENFQYSSVGETMSDAIYNLECAIDSLGELDSYISDAKGEYA